MRQFSIKNDRAVELLNDLTKRTGKGKTELVIEALERYRKSLEEDKDLERRLQAILQIVDGWIEPGARAPSKEEIEEMLGMP